MENFSYQYSNQFQHKICSCTSDVTYFSLQQSCVFNFVDRRKKKTNSASFFFYALPCLLKM